MKSVLSYLKNHILFLDGGMGTLLQSAGLPTGELPERWNLTRPDLITSIHRQYFDAGSNVVNTNTFGANSLKFGDGELKAIICAAVKNARDAAKASSGRQQKFVALDIGPTGKLLRPFGDLDFEDAVEIFAKTVRIGVSCGVDLIMIETMNDGYETKAALLAAKENCSLPVFVSNAYGEDGKLLSGADVCAMTAMLEGMGADVIGVNCSLGPHALMPVVEQYLKYASVPVLFKPNAGLPKRVDGRTVYDVGAEDFAREAADAVRLGVLAVGGCCGTTPEYIRALKSALVDVSPVRVRKKDFTVVSSYTHAVCFGGEPVLIGERINPTGKKRLKQALIEGDTDYILNEGIKQQDAGAQVLDVNVGLPEIDEPKTLQTAVCELQAVTDLPLEIDTSDTVAMERALRRYNGKAMVNSVNGKAESMRKVFPLVKKYGGLTVALTLDEDGIPKTAEGRVEIAKKIISVAAEYGISKKDLIFDPLAMAISAEPTSAKVALDALDGIRRLGCKTLLGVSNISFGLPCRDLINGTFFALALGHGLSAAIMNPHSAEMMKTYRAFRALAALDENCAEYIEFASSVAPQPLQAQVPNAAASAAPSDASALQTAIQKGLKEQARQLTQELLKTSPPLDIIQKEIIPALDVVGKGFEAKTVYLPQLLMSAEAAKSAFECIKATFSEAKADKCPFVIATVHGDIHDIGKNIVRLLLENYGFAVIDLGKDVPPEKIVDATVEHHAPLVGLSALMTTTVPAMEETIRQLRRAAPWCKIVVGGAVLTKEYAAQIGADKYSADAMESVRYAEEIYRQLKGEK